MRVQAGFSSLEIMVAGLILSGSILTALQWQASAGQVMQRTIEEYIAGVQAQEVLNVLMMANNLPCAESERLIDHWMDRTRLHLSEAAVDFNDIEGRMTLSWFSHPTGQRLSLTVLLP
ncbi:type IV pilus modification PilV family protein [Pseudohongiella spirulinae]|uniref:Uncharacterized protein n=1 Tax=Pseudohongiella spirulinae TaxID=1249552 RepID=A0A0S2KEQ7_9GAMM|nr:hypothetical protein [Pseudohongiella spirulinae]ALO46778.1 hypothetical protein PS2015_2141 [Pseudohongiella spirulinae]